MKFYLNDWCAGFCQKYYLWGVFKATKKHAVASNAEASMPSNLSNNAGTQDGESVGLVTRNPLKVPSAKQMAAHLFWKFLLFM